jgi:hypothetical protein
MSIGVCRGSGVGGRRRNVASTPTAVQNLIGPFRAKITATFDESRSIVVGKVRVRFYDTNEAIILEGAGVVDGTRLPLDQ